MEVAFRSRWKSGETVYDEVIMATSSTDAVSRIRLKNPYARILDISFDLSSTFRSWIEQSGGTMPDKAAAQLAKHLAMTLESGRDSKRAVKAIQTLTTDKPTLKRLKLMYEDLEREEPLSMALVNHGFPRETLMMLSNGEMTGQLPGVLRSISEMLKLRMSLKSELKKASFQPIVSLIIIFVFTNVLVFWIVPEYARMMSGIPNIKLTPTNKRIFDWDLMLVNHAGFIAVGGIVLAGCLAVLAMRPEFRDKAASLAGKFSRTIRTLRASVASYRFVTTMKTVTIAGIPAIKALEEMKSFGSSRETAIYRLMFIEMKDRALSLAEAARKTGVFLPFVSDSIAMALESGKLAEEMGELEKNTQELIRENLETIKTAITPIMAVVMGIILALAGLALYGPMFSVVTNFLSQHAG